MAKKKESSKSSAKTAKSAPEKKNNSLVIGLVVGAFIIIALIVVGMVFFNSEDAPVVVEPVVNITPVIEEPVVEVEPEVIVPEKFDLTPLEKDVLNLIRNKRQVFNLDRYILNFDLSEQLTNHTTEMARTGDISSLDQFSDTTKRAKAAGVSVKIIESNRKIDVGDNTNIASAIFEGLPKENLYLDDYTHIALSISEGDNNQYYVTLDLYKIED